MHCSSYFFALSATISRSEDGTGHLMGETVRERQEGIVMVRESHSTGYLHIGISQRVLMHGSLNACAC